MSPAFLLLYIAYISLRTNRIKKSASRCLVNSISVITENMAFFYSAILFHLVMEFPAP